VQDPHHVRRESGRVVPPIISNEGYGEMLVGDGGTGAGAGGGGTGAPLSVDRPRHARKVSDYTMYTEQNAAINKAFNAFEDGDGYIKVADLRAVIRLCSLPLFVVADDVEDVRVCGVC